MIEDDLQPGSGAGAKQHRADLNAQGAAQGEKKEMNALQIDMENRPSLPVLVWSDSKRTKEADETPFCRIGNAQSELAEPCPKEKPKKGRARRAARAIFRFAAGVALLLNLLVFIAIATVLLKPQLLEGPLAGLGLALNKPMAVSMDERFDVKARFNHLFPIALDAQIPIEVPVSEKLIIPINEIFAVPLDSSFAVTLSRPLRVKELIHVEGNLPLDTIVEAEVFGIKKQIPIKGVVPVRFAFNLDQEIGVDGGFHVHMDEPLQVKINQQVEAPINFVVKGNVPLKQNIMVPVSGDLDCAIEMVNELPLNMKLDLKAKDLGEGVKITGLGG
ncbi:MAG: hypothetical protein QMD09_09220 [Desulfatibacillaceae bacterium]|nr:hypothetical protein [Desulfatibacillaceae bacterium]